MRDWLARYWVAGALFMALALLALAPLLGRVWPPGLLLVYLLSPVYMLHQVEEHTGDRFRAFVNRQVFGGVEALTTTAVLWINLPGVWGLNAIALYAAALIAPGWGLAAAYLVLVNGLIHLAAAIRWRVYNPGLATGIVLFLPLAIATLALIPATIAAHAFGLGVAILVHAAIVVGTFRRAAQLKAT